MDWTRLLFGIGVLLLLTAPSAAAHSWVHADVDETDENSTCGRTLREERPVYFNVLVSGSHHGVTLGAGTACLFAGLEPGDPDPSATYDLA